MVWDIDRFIAKVSNRELLSELVIKELCLKVREVLITGIRSTFARAKCPSDQIPLFPNRGYSWSSTLMSFTKFYDLLEIFRIGGSCPDTNYVFLGDYVDRGYYSIETISLLICLKLRYPSRVYLVRGNHESRAVTQTYGNWKCCSLR